MKTDPIRLIEIKKTYEEGAKTFTNRMSDTNSAQNGGTIAEYRDMFLAYLPPSSTILDIGCGAGRDAKYFLERGHHVVGVDICETFISELSKTTRGEFIIGDIVDGEESFYTRKYDGIWSCASLVHMNRDESLQTIGNCSHSLKEGGCLFISTKYTEDETRTEKKESVSIPGIFKTYLFYNEPDLRADLESQGLRVLHCSVVLGPYGGDRFIQVFAQK